MTGAITRNEELLLLAVWKLQGRAYGLAIKRHLEDLLDKELNVAAVYIPLGRLEEKGLLQTREADPTPRRGGRRKKYYSLTAAGVAALNDARDVYERAWTGLPRLAFE